MELVMLVDGAKIALALSQCVFLLENFILKSSMSLCNMFQPFRLNFSSAQMMAANQSSLLLFVNQLFDLNTFHEPCIWTKLEVMC